MYIGIFNIYDTEQL